MDNFNRKIISSKKAIEPSNLNNPNQIYEKAKTSKANKTFGFLKSNLVLKYVIILLLVFAISIGAVGIFQDRQGEKAPDIGFGDMIPSDEIVQVSSVDEIRNLIINSSSGSNYDEGLDEGIAGPTTGGGYTSMTGSTNLKDVNIEHIYNTNVQVENIDEGDIVKVNGDYIYYITNAYYNYSYNSNSSEQFSKNALYIFKANGETLDIVEKIYFDNVEEIIATNDEAKVIEKRSYTPKDVLFTDKYLVLSVSTSINTYVEYQGNQHYAKYKNYTEFFIYDIKTYEQVKSITVPGNLLTTRLIDDQLYIISNYNDYKLNNNEDLIPMYTINDVFYDASLEHIFYCPAIGANVNSYIVVFRVTLAKKITVEDLYFLAPSINNVYVNHNAIYLIRTYNNLKIKEKNKVTDWPTSKIIVINIENELKFDGLIEVKGLINDRYWIDEYNGYLRIITTGTKYSYKTINDEFAYDRKSEVFNFLTVYKKNKEGKWTEISSITSGLGEEGESVKSARFNKNTATVVTFMQTDPLYYIDLTDHTNPVITSELKIPGFTVYQHPYKDNYVIGIGYETDYRGATIGYKVALFDISDKQNISQVGKAIVFDSTEYRSFSVMNNPKELFLDLDNNIFGFGVVKRTSNYNYTYPDGTISSLFVRSCFYLFEIDLEKENPISIIKEEEKIPPYSMRNYKTLERMVFIKDKYYLLAMDEVLIYQLSADGVTLINKLPLA